MKTFKNIFYKKRDYEATNIICCQGKYKPEKFKDMWKECEESEIDKLTHLFTENDIKYYGYL